MFLSSTAVKPAARKKIFYILRWKGQLRDNIQNPCLKGLLNDSQDALSLLVFTSGWGGGGKKTTEFKGN